MFFGAVTNHYAETTFVDTIQEMYQLGKKYREENGDRIEKIYKEKSLTNRIINGTSTRYFHMELDYKRLIWLGSKIREFIKTENQDLTVEIIKGYPEVIFDDGIEISIALYMTDPPSNESDMESGGINLKKGLLLSHCNFPNPIREQVIRWQDLIREGNPKEQKVAREYLEKAGLTCFAEKRRPGRPTKIANNRAYTLRNPLFSKWYPYNKSEDHAKIRKELYETYKTVRREISLLLKSTNKVRNFNIRSKQKTEKILSYTRRQGLTFTDREIKDIENKTDSEITKDIVCRLADVSRTTLERALARHSKQK